MANSTSRIQIIVVLVRKVLIRVTIRYSKNANFVSTLKFTARKINNVKNVLRATITLGAKKIVELVLLTNLTDTIKKDKSVKNVIMDYQAASIITISIRKNVHSAHLIRFT